MPAEPWLRSSTSGIHLLGREWYWSIRYGWAARRGRASRRSSGSGTELSGSRHYGISLQASGYLCQRGLEYAARTAYTFGGKGAGYGSPLFNNSGCYTEAPPSATTTNVNTPGSTPGTTGSGTVPVHWSWRGPAHSWL